MPRNFSVDRILNNIFLEAEEEFKDKGITRAQIVESFYFYFKYIKESIRDRILPSILVPKFGRFIPRSKKIGSYISYFKRKGDTEVVEEYEESKSRLIEEKKKRKRK